MSTSKQKNTPYHHGDLRNTLIAAGVKMISEQGEAAISMRKLAKEAGVSHNAPYMHFADKEALLAAIAEEGFHILTNYISQAIAEDQGDWMERLLAGCWAYVRFALEHPSHLNLMFRDYDPEKYPSLYEVSTGSLELLQKLIDAGQKLKLVIQGDSKQIATLIWSLLHGISVILAGRRMPPTVMGDNTPQELVDMFVSMMHKGLG
ncbi:MAG: TetR/AcrR family transcriptional regulator [Chloroflexota bacterium]